MPTIDTSSFDDWMDEFKNKYPLYELHSAEIAFQEMGAYLLAQVPEYPPESLDRLEPPDGVTWLRTDKQRRFFFGAVKRGDLPGWKWVDGHPQKIGGARRGNLGRGQTMQVIRDDASVQLTLGFDPAVAPHAPWVVGDDYPGETIDGHQMYQARIHVDRWWQFRHIIRSNSERGWELFVQSFWETFSRYINDESITPG